MRRVLVVVVGLVPAALVVLPMLGVGTSFAEDPRTVPGLSARVHDAYRRFGDTCEGLRWELLAGIGWVESAHGTIGGAGVDDSSGAVRPPIFGPELDGSVGPALPSGRWRGQWGLTRPWQQALGPMQLLPSTFDDWATDGDGDAVLDPHDIDDAVASAATYLCSGSSITNERTALLRYNRSTRYVDEVLRYANSLAAGDLMLTDGWLCPVGGSVSFTDTWLAPRSGGRLHQGVDMFAARSTPVIAPVAGRVEHYHDGLGGLSFRLWGEDGNYYYGTHMARYGRSGDVSAGAIVGYVGDTGNARGTGAHLHFEIHPARLHGDPPSAVNPTPTVATACASTRRGFGAVSGR